MARRTEELVYWIKEREEMRKRREQWATPPYKYGWSQDHDMGAVRYCNVRREDDKVTKWIAENWRNPNYNDPNLTLAMVMARMINYTDTLEKIGYPSEDTNLVRQKWVMQQIVGKKWTSAYTISTCGRKMGKEDYVFDHVLAQVAAESYPWEEGFGNLTPDWDGSLHSAHSILMHVDGLGSFLAAQVVADLKNTPGHPLASATDWWTWSAPGPGSLRGLAAYYGTPIVPSHYQLAIKDCADDVVPLLGDMPVLHMQDFQNCLCEFSKYMRVKEGSGHVRNKYPPR